LPSPLFAQSGSPTGQARDKKADNFLPKPLARGIVFQKSAGHRPGLLVGAGHSGFGDGAKRNGVEAIENKALREMPHFAPPNGLKGLRLRREIVRFAPRNESFRFSGFRASAPPKNAVCDARDGIARLCGSEGADDGPKWRRKRLKLFKTGSKWRPGSRTPGNRSGDLRYHADGRDVPPYAWGQAKLIREEQS